MTQQQARVEKGVPTGGQYAATSHTEPDVALTPAAEAPTHFTVPLTGTANIPAGGPTEFDAPWPSSLPDPEIDVQMSDNCTVETYVSVDGKTMSFWNDSYGSMDTISCGDEDPWEDMDHETREQARRFGRSAHRRAEWAAHTAMELAIAAPQVRKAICAAAAGKTPQPQQDLRDKETRDATAMRLESRYQEVREQMQRTYLVGVAVELQASYPQVASFELREADYDSVPEMHDVRDVDGNEIGEELVEAANDFIFKYRDIRDFEALTEGDRIDVAEAAAFVPTI
ncbi:hypothetical protein V6N00_13730 [Tersicoccus sp. MR15.9]|uniref:hypothetical protein n=1 Tax=Tersicoccus mangrovi TaxID=3121635 RepID=UPI002FE68AC1